MVAQIVDMNENVIIPQTSLRTGTIEFCHVSNTVVLLLGLNAPDLALYKVNRI